MNTMYFGVEGVAWALDRWGKDTGTKIELDSAAVLETMLKREPDSMRYSYFFGETGIRMALQSVSPSPENLAALKSCLRNLRKTETNEIMAGAPGALIAAQILWEQTRDAEVASFIRETAQEILGAAEIEPDTGLLIWRQNYGSRPTIYLGAAHGAAGNYYSLLRAKEHLPEVLSAKILQKAIGFVKSSAKQSDRHANWATMIYPGERDLLVHWCHGAPGFAMLFAEIVPLGADQEFDRVLIKAGSLVWDAGPLLLGPSLCHGTAGSGATMLKLFQRTGEQIWLDRARTLAMNTIFQVKEHEKKYGQIRYSLWTGDIGAAFFVRACVEGKFSMPILDYL